MSKLLVLLAVGREPELWTRYQNMFSTYMLACLFTSFFHIFLLISLKFQSYARWFRLKIFIIISIFMTWSEWLLIGIKVKQQMNFVGSIFKDFARPTPYHHFFGICAKLTVEMSRFNIIGTIVSVFSVIYIVDANTNVKLTAPQTNPGSVYLISSIFFICFVCKKKFNEKISVKKNYSQNRISE